MSDPHPCPACGVEVTASRLYCSRPCQDRMKTIRHNTDPDLAEHNRTRWRNTKRAAAAAAAADKPPRVTVVCSVCCKANYARGLCHLHYNRLHEPTKVERTIVNALISRGSDEAFMRVHARITIGVMVECPFCRVVMGATSAVTRVCHHCSVTVTLL